MTRIPEVALAVPPAGFNNLEEGSYKLRAPFFKSNIEGGALQVGLQPDEYDADQKEELTVTVTGSIGHHAVELARSDGQPFTVEYSTEGYREPVLSRAVVRLLVEESLSNWLGVEADGAEPLDVDPEGLNYLTHIVTTYALRKQAADKAAHGRG